MARDDYHVIVYQILAYLYTKLKKGEEIDPIQISHTGGKLININKKYWQYVIINLYNEGFIDGLDFIEIDGSETIIHNLQNCEITPRGIEYLSENSTIQKAKEFFKDIKEIIPFI